MNVTHDEVYNSYQEEIIMELESDTPEQMELNMEKIKERI